MKLTDRVEPRNPNPLLVEAHDVTGVYRVDAGLDLGDVDGFVDDILGYLRPVVREFVLAMRDQHVEAAE